jgi:hypothetical protein
MGREAVGARSAFLMTQTTPFSDEYSFGRLRAYLSGYFANNAFERTEKSFQRVPFEKSLPVR